MSDPDYYSILEIHKSASGDEIKKAYRRLALKWHPDKNPNNKEEAEHRFKLISEAYEILSDKSKRDIYDRYGKQGLMNGGPGTHHMPGEFDPFSFFGPFGFHFKDPMELFRDVFGASAFDSLFAPTFFMDLNDGPSQSRPHRSASHRSTGRQSGSPYHHAGQHHRSAHHRNDVAIPSDFGFMGGMLDLFGTSMFQPFGVFGGPGMSHSMSSSSTIISGPSGGGFRSVSTSSRVVDGRTVRVTKVVENGTETITEEVDGRVTMRSTRPRGGGALQAM